MLSIGGIKQVNWHPFASLFTEEKSLCTTKFVIFEINFISTPILLKWSMLFFHGHLVHDQMTFYYVYKLSLESAVKLVWSSWWIRSGPALYHLTETTSSCLQLQLVKYSGQNSLCTLTKGKALYLTVCYRSDRSTAFQHDQLGVYHFEFGSWKKY